MVFPAELWHSACALHYVHGKLANSCDEHWNLFNISMLWLNDANYFSRRLVQLLLRLHSPQSISWEKTSLNEKAILHTNTYILTIFLALLDSWPHINFLSYLQVLIQQSQGLCFDFSTEKSLFKLLQQIGTTTRSGAPNFTDNGFNPQTCNNTWRSFVKSSCWGSLSHLTAQSSPKWAADNIWSVTERKSSKDTEEGRTHPSL